MKTSKKIAFFVFSLACLFSMTAGVANPTLACREGNAQSEQQIFAQGGSDDGEDEHPSDECSGCKKKKKKNKFSELAA